MNGKARKAEKRLEDPSGKVIRHRAEKLLEKADIAVGRLRDGDDGEALHDARVAVRRLRSWFQAFRKDLHLKGKQKRELKRLAHSTNAARDAEVALQWLAARKHGRRRPDTARFAADLKALRDQSYYRVRQDFPPAWRKLSRKLAGVAAKADKSKRPFRKKLGVSLQDYAEEFEQAREQARRHPSAPHIHALRIAGKKLRYLADNALGKAPVAKGFLREMDMLHNSAGKIQDLQRLLALSEQDLLQRVDGRYRHLLLTGSSKRPGLTPDMKPYVQVSRAAAREQAQHMARFRKAYLGSREPACMLELRVLIHRLES